MYPGGMPASEGTRRITDSKALTAMSHPLRRRMLDVLRVYGPSTATAVAERTGQTPANISHHMRVMSKAGLVEEAPELAQTRRERWWRLVPTGLQWSEVDFAEGGGAGAVVAEAALSLNLEHHLNLVRSWHATAAEAQARRWEDTPFAIDKWLTLTPNELAELSAEMIDLLDRWAIRSVPDDGLHREPVFVFSYAVPAQP